jgi:hypothetical protein
MLPSHVFINIRTKNHTIILLATAWVLWAQQDFGLYTSDWQPVEGFSTYEQCTQAERSSFANNQKQFKQGKTESETIFKCLPDTIDPHAPKSKGK